MGVCNIRSLLIAAFVLCNCITWTSSRHHYTHNVLRHRSRHRRQGAGLFLTASYIQPGGEGAGAWGPWGEVSPCSRTCGGGVASQKRICLEVGSDGRPLCSGGDTKYFSCQTQDCPEGSKDFRSEQCSEYDDVSFSGVKYQWVPYTKGQNPCELNCKPRGERFYYRQKKSVNDGTRCNEESFDVCVNGICQPVGCDMMLGSNAREDKCRECRGNNTNCHSVAGRIDTQDLTKGYNDVLLIPAGATSIFIQEIRPSNNYLALRSKQYQNYYLNGNYHIDFPRSITIAGALWQYERSQTGLPAPDKLRCLGPTNEPLYLSLLLQDDNVGIEYEYSIPQNQAPPPDQQYGWVFDAFSTCSVSCGGGIQFRNVTCRSREELAEVDSTLCDQGMKPTSNQTCANQACAAQWREGPWSPCSKPCGEGGTRSRSVQCQKVITNGYPSIVDDSECVGQLGQKPALYQECNKNETCPTWFTGPWKPCDKLCGEGQQSRQVVCHQKINGRVQLFDDSDCSEEKPATEQSCILHPCEGVDWVVSDWSGCDSCLSKFRTRRLQCATLSKQVVNSSFCANHPKPVLEEDCDRTKLPPCTVQWYATQWSNCSVECGKGVQTRRVFCGLFDGSSVVKVDDSRCENETKYKDFRPCEVPEEKCPAKWFAGPWSECTKVCGGGEEYRRVMCLKGSLEAKECDPEVILDGVQACNTGPCDQDETLPPDSKTTPIMDEDYDEEDCKEDELYPEEGAEGEDEDEEEPTGSTLGIEEMFSDSPFTVEGSGTGSTSFTEIESEFTSESGSGYEPTLSSESLETEASGSRSTDEEGTGTTPDIGSTTESGVSSSEDKGTGSDDGTTETGVTSSNDEGTATSLDTSSTTLGSSESEGTDNTADTESSPTESTDLSSSTSDVTSSTEAGESTVTDDGTTETGTSSSDDESTDTSSDTDLTTEASSSDDSSTTETETETSASSTDDEGTATTLDIRTTTPDPDRTTTYGTTLAIPGSSVSEGTDNTADTELPTTESTDLSSPTSETSEESSTASNESPATDTTEESTDESTIEGSTNESTTEGSTDESTTEGSTEESTTGGSTEESSEGSTDLGSTTESVSSGSTDLEETGSTETGSTDISGSTEETGSTETTIESSSTTETSEETSSSEETTPYDWLTTVEEFTKRPRCKPRKKPKCTKSKFGCCPDKRTPAAGPFDAGCDHPKTCKDATLHGCCPDGVSLAEGPNNKGCPLLPCKETLYGCCKSDGKTPAEDNDQEGCPPPQPKCKSSKYGCCKDNQTAAQGPKKKGCPETQPKKGCAGSKHGCCHDNETAATGPNSEGCPCAATEFGCCPDNVAPARGPQMEGCVMNCNTSAFGCCPDGETPAHGPEHEGCCQLYSFGCCPDNYKPAEGPHLQGCGCQYAHFGCCPDNVTIARGNENEGCGCQYSEYGCCPDRHTDASGPNFEGCGCHTYQFGCCPDGATIAKGPSLQGCHCSQSQFGCCGDGQTAAQGPDSAGCDCAASKHGCCPDGQTEATGDKFLGCSDVPENRQASCGLDKDRGSCTNYSVSWYYDVTYGGCSRFWYGGCDGNGNRFASQAECEDVCIHPDPKQACKLPKIKGACNEYYLRWYYDSAREQCGQFVYGGCLGNDNNFQTKESCQKQCEPARSEDQCKLPVERGSCAGNFSRWGFDVNTGRCEQFIWGGCEGNGNRFGSEAACVQRCDPPGALKPECTLPQEVGNCTEKLARWSFSQTENRCVPFYFTGCNGNENNFVAEQHCTERCPSAFVPDSCALPAETGDCADYREKWYFDTAAERCRQFYYGGCGGNGNNFNTEVECESRCKQQQVTTTTVRPTAQSRAQSGQDFCFFEKDRGPCNQVETRWAYDSRAGGCEAFEYGGCGGNQNNFPSQEYCEQYCVSVQDLCQLPMSTGPCRGSEMRWFYDAASDSCSQFTYGGCQGNDNRFESREQCEQRCRSGPQVAPTATPTTTVAPVQEQVAPECRSSPVEACSEPGEVWYFEPYRRECLPHDNAPSGNDCRNTNVYKSQEGCERACGSFRGIEVCRYPVDAGQCQDFVAKFFFNETAQQCQPFTYGGCLGGPNRFSTVDECEDTCSPKTSGDPCAAPREAGPCRGYFIKWYFDRERAQCGQFVYGGCQGNENRFDSREECEGRCGAAPAQSQVTPRPEPRVPETDVGPECQTPDSLAPCGDDSPTFYYDSSRGQCARAEFGGCRYPNSYRSEEECERRCGAFKNYADVCREPLDPGPCRASIPKFWYNAATGACTVFAYGGCQGGANRFSSVEECEELCAQAGPAPRCLLPISSGSSCEAPQTSRYGYSPAEAECVRFVFAGCHGNGNNFYSYAECASVCRLTDYSCDGYVEECSRLRCSNGVQRTPTAEGCERCACAPAPAPAAQGQCEQYAQECAQLRCPFGIDRSDDGACERCTCKDHPCTNFPCRDGDRCVAEPNDNGYTPTCRTVNKPGACPPASPAPSEEPKCRRECYDDADCWEQAKCCEQGCSNLCLAPSTSATTPWYTTPRTTTYVPELQQAPQPNPETVPEVSGGEEGKATLRCLFHGNPPPKITWQRGQVTIDGTVGRYRLHSDGALEIVSLYRNDSGVYICIADNGLGTARQEVRLQVQDPVEAPAGISGEDDSRVTGELGQALAIRCLAFGHPTPTVAWYRGDNMVPYSTNQYEARGMFLQIKALELETLGEYACQAFNGLGKPASWSVVVQAFRPEGEIWLQSPFLIEREPAVVRVTPRPPPPPRQTTSVTSPPQEPEPQAPVFTVPVSTRLGVTQSTYQSGSDLSLGCEVDGYPTPEVYWTKDGVPLNSDDRVQTSDSRLSISRVGPADSGEYGCHARNAYSSHYALAQINVEGQFLPTWCSDNPFFANCKLIIHSKFCHHTYYSRFCCKSCVESGQMTIAEVEAIRGRNK